MSAATSCAGCGAPLSDPGTGDVITCAYCRRQHRIHRTAPRLGKAKYVPGQPVLVKWGSTWWDAVVLEVVGQRAWKIRYDGYSADWDEIVGPGRLRPRDERDADSDYDQRWDTEELQAFGAPPGIAPNRPGYQPGQSVLVLWNAKWYPARIKRVVGPSAWEIGYDGYASSWDEVVGPDRIRSDAAVRQVAQVAAVAAAGAGIAASGVAAFIGIAVVMMVIVMIGGAAAFFVLARPASGGGAGYGEPGGYVPMPGTLYVGQPVTVLWNGSWYGAVVMEPYPDGSALIHYDGWSESYDEVVSSDRIRVLQ